jgi:ABC transporter DrrB family efflux protein
MTAVTTQTRPTPGSALQDALILAWRHYKYNRRVPSLVAFSLMTPPSGRALADTVRNALVAFIAIGVGIVIGFRPDTSIPYFLAAIGIAVAFGYAFSWVAAFVGLTFKNVEAVHDAGFIWVIPLTFASSVLVPVDSMPTVLQWFADINPVTSVADATRALMLGDPAGSAVLHSLLWIAGLLVVFVPLAVRAYQRA